MPQVFVEELGIYEIEAGILHPLSYTFISSDVAQAFEAAMRSFAGMDQWGLGILEMPEPPAGLLVSLARQKMVRKRPLHTPLVLLLVCK